jgi:CO/xanthine dehydrogenase Mo-binding subunit
VIHGPTGRRLSYGALVDKAAALPLPRNIPLKHPKDFKLIGTPAKRLDAPDKVNGTAQFGIDVKVPGMKVATVAACPVFGGKLAGVGDSKAKAIKGVRQVVRLDDAVAVVADHMWAAKQGLAALDIRWTRGQTRSSAPPISCSSWQRRRSGRAWSHAGTAIPPRPWRAPPRRSRRFTRCRSSRTPLWSQ